MKARVELLVVVPDDATVGSIFKIEARIVLSSVSADVIDVTGREQPPNSEFLLGERSAVGIGGAKVTT